MLAGFSKQRRRGFDPRYLEDSRNWFWVLAVVVTVGGGVFAAVNQGWISLDGGRTQPAKASAAPLPASAAPVVPVADPRARPRDLASNGPPPTANDGDRSRPKDDPRINPDRAPRDDPRIRPPEDPRARPRGEE